MRKNLLALSIAAMVGGMTGAANAAVLTQNAAPKAAAADAPVAGRTVTTAAALAPTTTGVGHILAVPYFTTQGNNKMLLNITNTDQTNGKAVKLRFRGASNSDDIFDITVFLSPGDVWSADVAADADGFSRLVTNDSSCTLPYIQDIKDANNGRFKTGRVLNNDKAETREGYIEILNMADIPPATGATSLYVAIKHPAGKAAPCTASVLDQQYNDLTAANALARGYANPTGQLMANWIQVNVEDHASHSGEAVAVRANDANGASAAGNIVFFPQNAETPAWQAGYKGLVGAAADYSADPLLARNIVTAANYDFPDLSTPYIATAVGTADGAAGVAAGTDAATIVTADGQADALTQALATTSITNEYLSGDGLGTDWVFSMPTRRYHVAVDYSATVANRLVFRTVPANYFTAANTTLNSASGYVACVTPGSMRAYDREENSKGSFVISPDVAARLCGETSVLSFNGSDVFSSKLGRNVVPTGYAAGWMRINTPSAANVGAGAVQGLPVIGFAAVKASGINLGGTWVHRTAGR